ncbi:MAG: CAP domain-containing protein [Microscillaceae bacterium]|nr:CAP domain-containing protein [Microscillaceae bacterium]
MKTQRITPRKISHLLFLGIIWALSSTALWSQKLRSSGETWERSAYQTYTHQNFRESKAFSQKINPAAPNYALLNAALFFVSNEVRAKNGKAALGYAPALETAAWHHAKAMQEKGFFDHENPYDSQRANPTLRAQKAGVKNPFIAENIAQKSGIFAHKTYLEIAEAFVNQWMNTPAQRDNLLSVKAIQLGTGIFPQGQEWFAVQCFQQHQTIQAQASQDPLP